MKVTLLEGFTVLGFVEMSIPLKVCDFIEKIDDELWLNGDRKLD